MKTAKSRFPIGAKVTILAPNSDVDSTDFTIVDIEKNFVRVSFKGYFNTNSEMWIDKQRMIKINNQRISNKKYHCDKCRLKAKKNLFRNKCSVKSCGGYILAPEFWCCAYYSCCKGHRLQAHVEFYSKGPLQGRSFAIFKQRDW